MIPDRIHCKKTAPCLALSRSANAYEAGRHESLPTGVGHTRQEGLIHD